MKGLPAGLRFCEAPSEVLLGVPIGGNADDCFPVDEGFVLFPDRQAAQGKRLESRVHYR